VTPKEVAEVFDLSMDSTLEWLKKLRESGLIKEEKAGNSSFFLAWKNKISLDISFFFRIISRHECYERSNTKYGFRGRSPPSSFCPSSLPRFFTSLTNLYRFFFGTFFDNSSNIIWDQRIPA